MVTIHSALFYFRLIFGFVGIIILGVGSIFLAWQLFENRFFDLDLVVLGLFIANTSILCAIIWKLLKKSRAK